MTTAPVDPEPVDPAPVRLVTIDEAVLARLLAVAVTDATPDEVMAPVPGPPGWTTARRDAFAAYHRSRRLPYGQPNQEVTYAVVHRGTVVGAARLAGLAGDAGVGDAGVGDAGVGDADPTALEVGVWLGRSHRGRRLGTAVLSAAAQQARELGARRLVARTTTANRAAVRALAGHGFVVTHRASGDADAVLRLA